MALHLAHLDTPIGRLTLLAGDAGLRRVLWPAAPPPADAVATPHPVLELARRELDDWFAGRLTAFSTALDLTGATAFQRRAWQALAAIPYATTRSYGAQARALGRPGAARAVGAANARNPLPVVLPCHRLVAADGALTGFAGGLDVKRALLEHESRVLSGGAAAAGSARTRTSPAPRPRT
ncbi:MAG: methylated-DNA-[protein]-cysteine S-methyltransferase [bacterium]